ncbi:MAG TPA: MauE/DoxX family redox-associated membrane protein [Pseudonocardiaceae bacterium]
MAYLGLFGCWVLAGTLVIAALAKLRAFDDFAGSLVALRLVTGPARPTTGRTRSTAGPVRPLIGRARLLAGAVVGAELTAAALCLLPVTAVVGLGVAAALMAAFAVVAGTAGRRRAVVPCRCFGSGGAPLGRRHVLRNGLLLGLALAALPAGLAAPGDPDPSTVGLLLTLVTAAVAVALVVRFDDIADLVLPLPTDPIRS